MKRIKLIHLAYSMIMLLAFPAMFRISFEMYYLTLKSGPQMLLFSIAHSSPILFLTVLLSLPFFLVWALANLAILLAKQFRSAAGVSAPAALILLITQILHYLALGLYERWSSILSLRFLVCIIGLTSVIGIMIFAILREKYFYTMNYHK